jgi:hypothetical protein
MLINLTIIFSLVYLTNLIEAQRSNSKCCEDYCFGTDDERKQIRHFSSNTAYQVVKGAQSDRQYNVPGIMFEKKNFYALCKNKKSSISHSQAAHPSDFGF